MYEDEKEDVADELFAGSEIPPDADVEKIDDLDLVEDEEVEIDEFDDNDNF